MNKKIYLLPLLLLAVLFTSCEETKEAGKYDNWQARNEAFMDSLQRVYDAKTDPELEYLVPMNNLYVKVFYKKKIAKETGIRPLFTETVSVYYRGSYIIGEQFDGNFKGADPNVDFDIPAKFSIQSFYTQGGVSAWADILQEMKVGERWVTYIPWQVAYGASGQTNNGVVVIPGYSTLIFDMQLEGIVE